jgi:hypothetical protein
VNIVFQEEVDTEAPEVIDSKPNHTSPDLNYLGEEFQKEWMGPNGINHSNAKIFHNGTKISNPRLGEKSKGIRLFSLQSLRSGKCRQVSVPANLNGWMNRWTLMVIVAFVGMQRRRHFILCHPSKKELNPF